MLEDALCVCTVVIVHARVPMYQDYHEKHPDDVKQILFIALSCTFLTDTVQTHPNAILDHCHVMSHISTPVLSSLTSAAGSISKV